MTRPFLVIEDVGPARRHALFRLFGVTWAATRYAWLGPLFWGALGILVAFAERRSATSMPVVAGIGYGLVLFASNVLHTIGHIAAGWLIGAPMSVNVLTSTRDVNVYVEPGASAPAVRRLVRSLGGPAVNLLAGFAALAVTAVVSSRALSMFGYVNVAVAAWTLAPVPSMDGWIVWRTVFGRRTEASRPS